MYSDSIPSISGLCIYHSFITLFNIILFCILKCKWWHKLGKKMILTTWFYGTVTVCILNMFSPTSGSCVASGYTSCSGYTSVGNCWCDLACYSFRDCCPDIAQTCQPRMCLQLYPWCEKTCDHFTSFVDTTNARELNCETTWVDDLQWFPQPMGTNTFAIEIPSALNSQLHHMQVLLLLWVDAAAIVGLQTTFTFLSQLCADHVQVSTGNTCCAIGCSVHISSSQVLSMQHNTSSCTLHSEHTHVIEPGRPWKFLGKAFPWKLLCVMYAWNLYIHCMLQFLSRIESSMHIDYRNPHK